MYPDFSHEQRILLEKYNSILVERNKSINLTGHKSLEESWLNNILDSLIFPDYFKDLGLVKLLDIGSGGGAPAIPLKILYPQLNITMIDSVNKKVEFLNETISQLGLNNIYAVHTRIEDFAAEHREFFDIVTARAVAPLTTLIEYALPFVKVDGIVLAYKGKNWQNELEESRHALRLLCAEYSVVETKLDDKERILVVIKKLAATDKKYPRGKNLPRLKPLLKS